MAFDFPNAPTLNQVYTTPIGTAYSWDGEKWISSGALIGAVRYDLAQGLTANQMAQGRANIAVTKKNYIVNGGMQISQELGTTQTLVTSAGIYGVDAFIAAVSGTSGIIYAQQYASLSPGGSPYRLYMSVSTTDVTVDPGDLVYMEQRIEGQRVVDLKFGTAAAKSVTLQFTVNSKLAGTYCVVLLNGAYNRSYVAEYSIAAGEINTDVTRSITFPGDTAGTWATDNTRGMVVRWGLMSGTTFQQAAGAWGTVNAGGSANQVNFMGGANNFFLTDVSLTEGSVAPPFQLPDYADELRSCRRYFQLCPSAFGQFASTTLVYFPGPISPAMRATPTLAIKVATTAVNEIGVGNKDINAVTGAGMGSDTYTFYVTTTVAGTNTNRALLTANCISFNARL